MPGSNNVLGPKLAEWTVACTIERKKATLDELPMAD
jgi:hypothetical protein